MLIADINNNRHEDRLNGPKGNNRFCDMRQELAAGDTVTSLNGHANPAAGISYSSPGYLRRKTNARSHRPIAFRYQAAERTAVNRRLRSDRANHIRAKPAAGLSAIRIIRQLKGTKGSSTGHRIASHNTASVAVPIFAKRHGI